MNYVEQRIASATQAILSAQASANEETKSSAGDKYETGRAMAQLEIEKNGVQLAEAKRLKQVLEKIGTKQRTETVQVGSLVITNQGNFYIAIAAGQFTINGETYFAISPSSPIAQKLLSLKFGDRFIFNSKEFVVKRIV